MNKESYVKPELRKDGNIKAITQNDAGLVCSPFNGLCPGGGEG